MSIIAVSVLPKGVMVSRNFVLLPPIHFHIPLEGLGLCVRAFPICEFVSLLVLGYKNYYFIFPCPHTSPNILDLWGFVGFVVCLFGFCVWLLCVYISYDFGRTFRKGEGGSIWLIIPNCPLKIFL